MARGQARYNNPTVRAVNQKEVIGAIEGWLQSFDDINEALAILEKQRGAVGAGAQYRATAAKILSC